MKSEFIKQITNQEFLGFSKAITNQQDEMTRGGF
jgi:hypothetical protein